jgi:hypothetical protein
MNKYIILFFLSFCIHISMDAQTIRSYERAGEKAFQEANYHAAMEYYAKVLTKKPGNQKAQYKYAECARLFYAYDLAEKQYLGLLKDAEEDFPLLRLRLGQVNFGQGDYVAAKTYLEQFTSQYTGSDAAAKEEATTLLNACSWASEHLNDRRIQSIAPLPKSINSPYSDFAPHIKGDTLFFSSYRFDKKGDRSKPKKKITKPMLSISGRRARPALGRGFPTSDTSHTAHIAFSRDGNYLFFNKCTETTNKQIRCDIWMTVRNIRGRWNDPVKLPEPVNLPGYTSTQVSVGFDSLSMTQQLWFASDRPGGKGGMDIWSVPLDTTFFCPCNRPLAGKKFRMPAFPDPKNEARVNSASNEMTPFFFEKDQSLYYSSDALPGFGAQDVYVAAPGQGGENMGPGINTSYNDVYLVLYPDGQQGLLSSNRPGALYLDPASKACCNDLFRFDFPVQDTTSLTEAPEIIPQDSLPVVPEPVPTPEPKLRDFVGLTLYFDNDEPDKRTKRTTTKKSYEETVRLYLEQQELYMSAYSKNLAGEKKTEAEQEIEAMFQDEILAGFERLDELCELLVFRMNEGETVEIILKGFTSPRAKSDYNLNLGKRRISSVRNQFDSYNGGVLREFIDRGQLRISETSFGETTVRSGVSDSLKDERNSIYHPAAARERRVEIVEIHSEK